MSLWLNPQVQWEAVWSVLTPPATPTLPKRVTAFPSLDLLACPMWSSQAVICSIFRLPPGIAVLSCFGDPPAPKHQFSQGCHGSHGRCTPNQGQANQEPPPFYSVLFWIRTERMAAGRETQGATCPSSGQSQSVERKAGGGVGGPGTTCVSDSSGVGPGSSAQHLDANSHLAGCRKSPGWLAVVLTIDFLSGKRMGSEEQMGTKSQPRAGPTAGLVGMNSFPLKGTRLGWVGRTPGRCEASALWM